MTSERASIDHDEILLGILGGSAEVDAPPFQDDLYARLAQVCREAESSDIDLAVLVRHLLRRWSLRDGRSVRVVTAASVSIRLRRFAATVDLREYPSNTWSATDWQPEWLDALGVPDAAAAAGTNSGRRFHGGELAADPFFEQSTGYASYRTPGQRAACRAVVSAPRGSTVVAMLPTGSGKTEVALCLADQHRFAVTLIVVPTVALAYDFERRFRDHYARRYPRADKASLHFAWTASTGEELRDRLRSRIRDGRQPILITSPESVSRALRSLLMDAAATGRLGGLVIDEAHLVTQWGRDFRPEFRTLAHLRDELLQQAIDAGHPRPTTLLLSATLGPYELRDLHALFGEPGPCTLVAANALRAEPDLWVAEANTGQQREEWVLEALAHLPRPAVLYVTSPDRAEEWFARLQRAGYRRLAVVTSRTSHEDRSRTLAGLRAIDSNASSVDLVVATSAFGLGIDYPHVRSVVHACLPETVDRWYQELGRGGRDGHASTALLLTAPGDRGEATTLVTKVLTDKTALKRWSDLWDHRQMLGDRAFVDLEGSRGSVTRGSYNHRWNAQLVQGLVELEALSRQPTDVEDRQELTDESGQHRDWMSIELRRADLRSMTFWSERWTPWQQAESERSKQALKMVVSLVSGSVPACEAIAQSYRPDAETYRRFGRAAEGVEPLAPCGRCPGCRQAGIVPPEDPPPRPAQVWPLPDDATPRLDDLAEAAGAQDGLVLLVTDDHSQVAHRLAQALIRRGVRHLAGPIGDPVQHQDWLFIDPLPIGPSDLTPCSSFVVYPPTSRVSSLWLSPRARLALREHAPPAFDVLLLARGATVGNRHPGRDLPALDALTALHVLGA
ncbi:ATP-dependent DNA helicase RecQ [Planosporangium thailandense]|uniref:DNA 3'-5' helicase n=1 Tax=Planosporangium thailandense TaxID=765197 RepID=A0ABX0Y089_9ACTN|nr:protein DpdF [Planosporangium thailandense]NJC70850.1 ATP-dependent DNA helicase RecQ [Planosporangium thailandense]